MWVSQHFASPMGTLETAQLRSLSQGKTKLRGCTEHGWGTDPGSSQPHLILMCDFKQVTSPLYPAFPPARRPVLLWELNEKMNKRT